MSRTEQKPLSIEEAFAYCERLARTHYENFTVGSWFLPRGVRRHVYSVYAYCRSVDDLGDEAKGDRLAHLDRWEEELRRSHDGTATHPVMVALGETNRRFQIPIEPYLKLIEANRMDQTVHRFPTYADLLHYCDHSANPVGHLFLYLFGYRDPERQRLADCTCTALQLTNFWQDVRRDLDMGRIYIPMEDMERFVYSEAELERSEVNDAFRRLMAFEVARARSLFEEGLQLVDMVEGAAKLDIKLFSLGGMRVLDAIERAGYDVLSKRPALSKREKIGLMLSTMVKLKLAG
ncbi:MAG: squalene synthase HpnC [Chloroflexi bacterium]|nr:squalene synthase HpnC [Chloroflexota bacterium]